MKRTSAHTNGFTLLELTVAAGLMTIIMIMLYTIFGSASAIFSGADARIEIYQTARAIIDTMSRDLSGAIVDKNGCIFQGWNNIDNRASNRYPRPDWVVFRTMTETSAYGTPVEVCYRLNVGSKVLEKGVSTQLTTTLPSAGSRVSLANFSFTPIGMHVREFQLRYLMSDIWNRSMDTRTINSKWLGWSAGSRHVWPPGSAAEINDSAYFSTAAEAWARIPAAVEVTLRIGDSHERQWLDYFSSDVCDGADQPAPDANFIGFSLGKRIEGRPIDGIKQGYDNTARLYYADEIGIVFRQVIFIPTYTACFAQK